MKSAASSDEALLRRLVENNDESAVAALFISLYRQSPELRHWLREDYARDPEIREQFDKVAKKERSVSRFAELTQDNRAWKEERKHLKQRLPIDIYGGLMWKEVVQLIHRYQAGTLDIGAFLLARHWRTTKKASPALMWAGLAFLESVLPSGRRRLLRHLDNALAFVKKLENKKERRSLVGYSDWWKLNTLFYILRTPREAYSIREFRTHLASLGLKVGTKEMRRFCKKIGIKRDMLPGRPRHKALP